MGQLPIDHGRVYPQQRIRGIMSTMVKFLSIQVVYGGVLVAVYSEVLFNPESGLGQALGAMSGTPQQRCDCFSSRNGIGFSSLGERWDGIYPRIVRLAAFRETMHRQSSCEARVPFSSSPSWDRLDKPVGSLDLGTWRHIPTMFCIGWEA